MDNNQYQYAIPYPSGNTNNPYPASGNTPPPPPLPSNNGQYIANTPIYQQPYVQPQVQQPIYQQSQMQQAPYQQNVINDPQTNNILSSISLSIVVNAP